MSALSGLFATLSVDDWWKFFFHLNPSPSWGAVWPKKTEEGDIQGQSELRFVASVYTCLPLTQREASHHGKWHKWHAAKPASGNRATNLTSVIASCHSANPPWGHFSHPKHRWEIHSLSSEDRYVGNSHSRCELPCSAQPPTAPWEIIICIVQAQGWIYAALGNLSRTSCTIPW